MVQIYPETENLAVDVSLLLLTFNQAGFVASAAQSCLAQKTLKPIEIVFSDDASSDDTFAILEAIALAYRGPHIVRVRKNLVNLGIGAHYNAAIATCRGELVVTAAGDDLSEEDRIEKLYAAWVEADRKADLITSNLVRMDMSGNIFGVIKVSDLQRWTRPEQWFRKRPYVVGAAHAFTKRLHARFGDFLEGVVYEDQIMALRASMAGGGLKIADTLVRYREGGVSQQKANATSGVRYLAWSKQSFLRQMSQHEQIKLDLKTAQRTDLWSKKLEGRLRGARLVIELHKKSSFSERFQFAISATGVGWFFRVKHCIYISRPEFAAAIQRLQLRLKKLRV